MDPGRRDRRITLQRREVVQDAYGQEVETWKDLATTWAERRNMRGNERWVAQQVNAKIECKYFIPYMDGLTPLHRLIDRDRVYDIVAVLEIGRCELLELVVASRDVY
jgi:SPP1 family predicted phage head-tail adaptor